MNYLILASALTLNGLFGSHFTATEPPQKPQEVTITFEGTFKTPHLVTKSLVKPIVIKVEKTAKVEESEPVKEKPETIKVEATAYTAHCVGCSGITKTGVNLITHPYAKVVAVDPSVIPLGSKLYIPGYGVAYAEDTGGAINGYHVDLYMKETGNALDWGKKYLDIQVLKEGES